MKISVLYVTNRPGGLDVLTHNLRRQTFDAAETEIVVVDGFQERIGSYGKYAKGLPKRDGDVWTLNKDYNLGLQMCTGELVVFLQDYLWIPPDALQRFWEDHVDNPRAFITGVGHKALYPDTLYVPDGHYSTFNTLEMLEKPTGISEVDHRATKDRGIREVDYSNWEMNLAAAPLQELRAIGGFEEDMDRYYGGDNIIVAFKAFLNGCPILLDSRIESVGYNQCLFGRPTDWEEKHANKGRLTEKLKELANGWTTKSSGSTGATATDRE